MESNDWVEINQKKEPSITEKLSKVVANIKSELTKLEDLREDDRLYKLIDYIDHQVAETEAINEEYNKLLERDPNSFETVYHALTILSKNTDIFNDKVEVHEIFINEMDKKIKILAEVQEKTLSLIEKLPGILEKQVAETAVRE